MQCVNCGFENIPGMKTCVRCQSSLALDSVVVAPPRASRYGLGTTLRQWWNVVRTRATRLPDFLPRWKRSTVNEYAVKWEAVLASLIPGLGHIRYANKVTGFLLLAAWCAFMLAVLLSIGLPGSPWLLAGAVAVHATAIMSFLGPLFTDTSLLIRLMFGLLVFAGVRMGLYYPLGLAAERFYAPFPVVGLNAGQLLKDDDVLLYRGPWASRELRRGDLVVYEMPRFYGNGVLVRSGYGVDRVVGLPGDRVEIVKRELRVNDRPVPQEQLPLGNFEGWNGLAVGPADGYVILPSQLPMEIHAIRDPERIVGEISVIPDSQILGRVVYRIRPWSRFGPVQ